MTRTDPPTSIPVINPPEKKQGMHLF